MQFEALAREAHLRNLPLELLRLVDHLLDSLIISPAGRLIMRQFLVTRFALARICCLATMVLAYVIFFFLLVDTPPVGVLYAWMVAVSVIGIGGISLLFGTALADFKRCDRDILEGRTPISPTSKNVADGRVASLLMGLVCLLGHQLVTGMALISTALMFYAATIQEPIISK